MENEKQNSFLDWLQSLRNYELLDLIMNCGYLLGKTVKPPQVEQEEVQSEQSEICDDVQSATN